MNHLLHSPLFALVAVTAYYVFSAAAGAMLPPAEGKERTRYGYLFRFVQILAANSHRLGERLPGLAAGLAAAADVPAGGRTTVDLTETIHHES